MSASIASPHRSSTTDYDVLIVGAGAAGLLCAIEAGKRGRRVVVLEHNQRVGLKIAISGGGRCNFTNLGTTPDHYLSDNPDFCKSALARYTPWDFIALVEKHRIPYHEKKLGQQFCDGSSRAIIEMLLTECSSAGVEIRTGCRVEEVRHSDRFQLITTTGEITGTSLVIATGGLSFPKLGSTDFGYRIAKQFGLKVTPTRPGLVPLTFISQDQAWQGLSGLSLPVIAHHAGQAFRENLLITHRGLSGPAILQISSFWRPTETIHFDLLPDFSAGNILERGRTENTDFASAIGTAWPRRFAEVWSERETLAKPLRHYKARELTDLTERLHRWPMTFSGTEGYPKAEVTIGGVDTRELSSKTMEARRAPGLFFIGEVTDVTGWLGGYNFQWAWASGHAAGQVA